MSCSLNRGVSNVQQLGWHEQAWPEAFAAGLVEAVKSQHEVLRLGQLGNQRLLRAQNVMTKATVNKAQLSRAQGRALSLLVPLPAKIANLVCGFNLGNFRHDELTRLNLVLPND